MKVEKQKKEEAERKKKEEEMNKKNAAQSSAHYDLPPEEDDLYENDVSIYLTLKGMIHLGDQVPVLIDNHNPDREREQVTRRTTYTKTQRKSRTQEKGVMSRKTLMRILTNSMPQGGEAMLKRTRTRTLTSKLPEVVAVVVVVVVGASLPLPSTTTRRRLTMRLASTPTTSYPILKW